MNIDHAFLKSLKKGDQFKTEGMFSGLSDRQIKWTVVSCLFGGKQVLVRGSYFGIDMGEFMMLCRAAGKVIIHAATK